MKILELCKNLFGKTSGGANIKKFFQEMRETEKYYDNDRYFFMVCSQYLGGRGYNEFFDYSLFAIKLNSIHHKLNSNGWVEGSREKMTEVILDLLADDRHDMWQNTPLLLDKIATLLDSEMQGFFWSDVVDAMIRCINVYGTGDVSVNFVIKE